MSTLNKEAEHFVRQSMSQTQGAMEQYFGFLQNALSSFPMTSPEITAKIKGFTEDNLAASGEFIQQLSQAKDIQEVVKIQCTYMQDQFRAFTEQSKSLTESFTKAATSSMQNPFTPAKNS